MFTKLKVIYVIKVEAGLFFLKLEASELTRLDNAFLPSPGLCYHVLIIDPYISCFHVLAS